MCIRYMDDMCGSTATACVRNPLVLTLPQSHHIADLQACSSTLFMCECFQNDLKRGLRLLSASAARHRTVQSCKLQEV